MRSLGHPRMFEVWGKPVSQKARLIQGVRSYSPYTVQASSCSLVHRVAIFFLSTSSRVGRSPTWSNKQKMAWSGMVMMMVKRKGNKLGERVALGSRAAIYPPVLSLSTDRTSGLIEALCPLGLVQCNAGSACSAPSSESLLLKR